MHENIDTTSARRRQSPPGQECAPVSAAPDPEQPNRHEAADRLGRRWTNIRQARFGLDHRSAFPALQEIEDRRTKPPPAVPHAADGRNEGWKRSGHRLHYPPRRPEPLRPVADLKILS
jgi:hypothetical protein